MRMPRRLYEWMDRHDHIPWIVREVLWPGTHFCPDMDYLLVGSDFKDDCFCDMWPQNSRLREARLREWVEKNPGSFDWFREKNPAPVAREEEPK